MEAIKSKIKANKNFKHFLAYSASFIGYGCIFTSLGPLIPYLAAATGRAEPDFSILFFARSMGFIFGAIVLRYIEKYLTFHQIIIGASYGILMLTFIFSFTNDFLIQLMSIFFISVFCCGLEIMVNVSIL